MGFDYNHKTIRKMLAEHARETRAANAVMKQPRKAYVSRVLVGVAAIAAIVFASIAFGVLCGLLAAVVVSLFLLVWVTFYLSRL